MNTLCFVLVLFATRIIYTKEESSLNQNKTASTSSTTTSTTRSPPSPRKDLHLKIDFSKVELFKDDDELPSNTKDLTPDSNQSEPQINSMGLSRNGTIANTKRNETSKRIYEDYDNSDLQLDKYKLMIGPNRYKKIDATKARLFNLKRGRHGIVTKQYGLKVPGQYLILPNGTHLSGVKIASDLNKSSHLRGSTGVIHSDNSVAPMPWVISPACLQQNESKYLFSVIFNKKPMVHVLTDNHGTVPNNQTPDIVIDDSSVTLKVSDSTLGNDNYDNVKSSDTITSEVLKKTSNSVFVKTGDTLPVDHKKFKAEEKLLKSLSEFSKTIQNNTFNSNNSKPKTHVTLSKVADSKTVPGEVKIRGNDKNQTPQLDQILQYNIVPVTTVQQQMGQRIPNVQQKIGQHMPKVQQQIGQHIPNVQQKIGQRKPNVQQQIGEHIPNVQQKIGQHKPKVQQKIGQLIPNIHPNASVKEHTVTTLGQKTKKTEPNPLLPLEKNRLKNPLPGVTSNKAKTSLITKPQSTINNVLSSEVGGRSFFPPEPNENLNRSSEEETVGDLITQKETDVRSPNVLYELFKNITATNVINEDLNRKLLNENQIHTQQNWQMIKGNIDILNALKNKNEQNISP